MILFWTLKAYARQETRSEIQSCKQWHTFYSKVELAQLQSEGVIKHEEWKVNFKTQCLYVQGWTMGKHSNLPFSWSFKGMHKL